MQLLVHSVFTVIVIFIITSIWNETSPIVVVLVLSKATNVRKREFLRKTIASGPRVHVLYVIGKTHVEVADLNHVDIVLAPLKESYSSLPGKLKYGMGWVVDEFPSAKCVVKVDDDMVYFPEVLEQLCEQVSGATVVGRITENERVQLHGKWKENNYHSSRYPPFPKGSHGYLVTKPVLEYIRKNNEFLREFQGEDTSIGIWLSGVKVVFNNLEESFRNDRECSKPNAAVIGHSFTSFKEMEWCVKTQANTKHGKVQRP